MISNAYMSKKSQPKKHFDEDEWGTPVKDKSKSKKSRDKEKKREQKRNWTNDGGYEYGY